ncbi:hypothetical protein BH11PLA1_BH11PLA1_13710 [soil metagenome]
MARIPCSQSVVFAAAACAAGLALLTCASTAHAQLRVADWNVTNYSSGRTSEFQTAIYATAPNGLRFDPDILLAQEIVDATGRQNFLNLLNSAPSGHTDWAATPFVATPVNPSSNPSHVMFYRTTKVDLLTQPVPAPNTVKVLREGTTGAASTYGDTGSCAVCPPRDTHRYLVRLKDYPAGSASELYLYTTHFKAGSAGSDQARRTPEADRLRADSNALPIGTNFLFGADFNIQNSNQTAYENLLVNGSNAAGRFIDPIITPGSWENNSAFRVVHTQEPASQMDSRHDQILIAPTLRNGSGMEYIGSTTLPYSTVTWNDPNHSYRCWGNDGTTYGTPIATASNTEVGPTIAAALITSVQGNGHLPVFLNLRVPARLAPLASAASDVLLTTRDFGTVQRNALATVEVVIRNGAPLVVGQDPHFARFSRDGTAAGFETLTYSLSASGDFSAPAGTFTRTAGPDAAAADTRVITLDTASVGLKTGTLTITSNAANQPTILITLTGEVIGGCVADIADDAGNAPPVGSNNGVNEGDYNAFFNGFFTGAPYADIADDAGNAPPLGSNNGVNEGDYNAFFNNFFLPC